MEPILPMQTFKVACPRGHETGGYKTAVDDLRHIQVYCPHCGAGMKVTK